MLTPGTMLAGLWFWLCCKGYLVNHSRRGIGSAVIVVVGVLAVAVFKLPMIVLLLLACPVAMMFMMRGGNHGGTDQSATKDGKTASIIMIMTMLTDESQHIAQTAVGRT